VDGPLAIILALGGLLAFDLAAVRWGRDSRDTLRDDHRR
jgi:hypothetical protein